MCSQFNSSSSSPLMVLPKYNFLSSRHILHFQDGYQNSLPQDTQEAQLAQNQEDHRQQDTHHQQQQQEEDNNKKEEEELFKDNVKDYNNNNNKSSTITSQVKSDKGGVYTDLTSTFKKDNIRDYNNKSKTVISQLESDEGRVYTDLTSTFKKDNVKDYSKKIIPTSPKRVSSTTTQMLICPPAPKKKKTIQVTKRSRLHHDQEERVFLDVYDEIESLFPPALLADLDNKIKKARKITPIL